MQRKHNAIELTFFSVFLLLFFCFRWRFFTIVILYLTVCLTSMCTETAASSKSPGGESFYLKVEKPTYHIRLCSNGRSDGRGRGNGQTWEGQAELHVVLVVYVSNLLNVHRRRTTDNRSLLWGSFVLCFLLWIYVNSISKFSRSLLFLHNYFISLYLVFVFKFCLF